MAVSLLQSQLGTDSRRRKTQCPKSPLVPQHIHHSMQNSLPEPEQCRMSPKESHQLKDSHGPAQGEAAEPKPGSLATAVQEPEASGAQLALTQENQSDLCSLWCSWHTTGSSRLFTDSTSSNEGSRTIKPTQRRNSRQHGVVGAVSILQSSRGQ